MLRSLTRLLKPGASRRRYSQTRVRPTLERLQDRIAPAWINVISGADNNDPVITSGHAGTENDPYLAPSLRSAITFTNGNPDPSGNVIALAPGGYYYINLTGTPGESDNVAGEFAILPGGGNLGILGNDAIIDGNQLNRVFDINPANAITNNMLVSFLGITIRHGLANGTGIAGSGGGIRCQGDVRLSLTGQILNNSASADGGGIFMGNSNGTVPWTLTLGLGAISNNHAGVGGGGVETIGGGVVQLNGVVTGNSSCSFGGGIYLAPVLGAVSEVTITSGGSGYLSPPAVTFSAAPSGGTTASGIATISGGVVTGVTITNSGSGYTSAPTVTFSAPPSGTSATGTATIVAFESANLRVDQATITSNSSVYGGAIENDGNGSVLIGSSSVVNNSATFGGGLGDQNGLGTLTTTACLFTGNVAQSAGGAISAGGPSTTIYGCLFTNNSSTQGVGGGIFAHGSTLVVERTTIANNAALNGGNGVELRTTGTNSSIINATIAFNMALNGSVGDNGGGIDASSDFTGSLELVNDTINGNSATNGGGIFWAGATGSAITVQNTVFARNQASTTGPDANNAAGAFNDAGGNLIGVAGFGSGNTGFTAGTTQTGTVATPLNPVLGPLQFNGVDAPGATALLPTETLRPHSTAIDKGVAVATATADERGFPRPDSPGENPDIGAFESQVGENAVFFLKTDNSLWRTTASSTPTMLSPAGTILSIASVTNDAGFDVLFAITSDRNLWQRSEETTGPSFWTLLSTGSFLSITGAVNNNGDSVVAGVLDDHSLWEYSSAFPGDHWQMLSPSGTILSASAFTDDSSGMAQEVTFAITSDSNLWRHTTTGWTLLSVGSFQSISAGSNSARQAVVYGVLTDNSLWESNPAFSGDGWRNLSPAGTILSVSAGTADQVFAITSDHHLWAHDLSGWNLVSVGNFASISGNQTPAGTGVLFAVLADSSLWEFNPAFPGSHWQDVVTSDVLAASAPQRY